MMVVQWHERSLRQRKGGQGSLHQLLCTELLVYIHGTVPRPSSALTHQLDPSACQCAFLPIDMASKPSVIILGGIDTCARPLAAYLVPLEGEPLVSHLRIVDKFSVAPPTTYIGSEFPKVLENPIVEYRQANLQVPSVVASAFEPTEGKPPFDYVFDLTGDIRYDRPEEVHIKTTFQVSRLVGLEAARRNVKAYVRLQQPFYEVPERGSHDEKEDAKPLPGVGIWWHETLRTLAAIPNLNLVILRVSFYYGPYVVSSVSPVTSALTLAAVYGHLKQPFKTIWSPGKNPTYTVHVYDVAAGLWASAEWIAKLGRKEADMLAGEEIIFHNEKSKLKEVEGTVPADQKQIAPLFNLSDDGNTDMLTFGTTISNYFGTTFEFHDLFTNLIGNFGRVFKSKEEGFVEEINEQHVSIWSKMLQQSDPPVSIEKTPLSAYVDSYQLAKHSVGFKNTKIKEIMGLKLVRPTLNATVINEMIEKWKAEGNWPIIN